MKADEQLNVDLVEGGIVQSLRENFHNAPRGLDWRIAQLRAAETMVLENKGKIFAALFSDLKKSASESTVCEVNDVLVQIRYLIHNLHRLAKPKNMPWSGILDLSGYKWSQRKEPRGVVLVLGAWNYPFSLCINPLLGAIAAGNAVLLKPSEHARATSRLLSNLISAYLDKQMVLVLEGGITVASRLVEEDFDFICYTGGRVGALEVASACAKRLRPVMLELGGKSPCYIHSSADIVAAAKAIVYSKSLNAGQTCIAPDYCLVDGAIFDDLVGELKRVMRSWFGEGPDQMRSPHLGRIVNLAHFHRLAKLLDVHANDIIYDGFTSKDDLFISLTLILSPDMSSEIMKEEIFGPILPVVKVIGFHFVLAYSRTKLIDIFAGEKFGRGT
jgi:acyl-CoA reductase-like NAD-dependent aldehyde dehydrogenase